MGDKDYNFNDYKVTFKYAFDWPNKIVVETKSKRQLALESIKKVIFNDPATIVYWADGTKTVVKCDYSYEKFDKEKGLAMAIAKKHFDNEGYYYDVFKKWIPELDDKQQEKGN